MKIVTFALAIIIFSATVTLFNTLGIFDHSIYSPGYAVNQSDVNGIYEVDSSGVTDKEGITDQIADAFGFEMLFKIISVIGKALGYALNMGGLFAQYVPGEVGQQFAILINTITYFIYAWGGIQLWRKVSTKSME